MYFSQQNQAVYFGDKSDWSDVELISERPSPFHIPVIDGGEHTGDWVVADSAGYIDFQRSELQRQRDESLQLMTHQLADESLVQVRPQDMINFQTAIALGETSEWVLADNSIRDLTVTEMQECLQAGMQQGKAIWDDYIASLKSLTAS